MTNPIEIGTRIGQAIARSVIADDTAREWTGLDAQDGDQLTAAGIEPNTPEWREAEDAAEKAYLTAISPKSETINAKWIDGQYVASPVGGPEEWYSVDGDNWINEKGNDADSPRFHAARIVLCGGPRDGEKVA